MRNTKYETLKFEILVNLSLLYSRKSVFFFLFNFVYFDLQCPNLEFAFVGKHKKTSMIRKQQDTASNNSLQQSEYS